MFSQTLLYVTITNVYKLGEYATLDSPATKKNLSQLLPQKCHCPVGPPSIPFIAPRLVVPNRSLPDRKSPAMKLFCLLLVSFFAAAYASSERAIAVAGAGGLLSDPEQQCVYTVYVRTGSIWKGGTDSAIGVTLLGSDGTGVRIADLEQWGGMMGAGHDYYERGNLDIFSGRGPCMERAPCWANVTSDGAGAHHGWYCNYVEVTATGPHMGCAQQLFTVEQWLATDASPYRLYTAVDNCGDKQAAKGQEVRASIAL
uniref:PLAT domain-containing protein n=1 Tax=Triticum aestivum TaxID=4565 RepID=A0A3B6C847_WHEAT